MLNSEKLSCGIEEDRGGIPSCDSTMHKLQMNALTKLGLSKGTKLLIIHADDAGLSHAENLATIAALKAGSVNSYSIMTTCPWFKEIANFAVENKEFDYGIHLTLTCEWKNYKWGPILSRTEVPSLVDSQGNFYISRDDFKKKVVYQM